MKDKESVRGTLYLDSPDIATTQDIDIDFDPAVLKELDETSDPSGLEIEGTLMMGYTGNPGFGYLHPRYLMLDLQGRRLENVEVVGQNGLPKLVPVKTKVRLRLG